MTAKSPEAYPFRSSYDDTIIELSFEKMMQADCMGCITIKGEEYRRARDIERERNAGKPAKSRTTAETAAGVSPAIVSDALGFAKHQLADFEADRKANGFNNVEFVQDPSVPEFVQVKCTSPRAYQEYVKHRGMFDKNSRNGSGVILTEADFDRAKAIVEREHASHPTIHPGSRPLIR